MAGADNMDRDILKTNQIHSCILEPTKALSSVEPTNALSSSTEGFRVRRENKFEFLQTTRFEPKSS